MLAVSQAKASLEAYAQERDIDLTKEGEASSFPFLKWTFPFVGCTAAGKGPLVYQLYQALITCENSKEFQVTDLLIALKQAWNTNKTIINTIGAVMHKAEEGKLRGDLETRLAQIIESVDESYPHLREEDRSFGEIVKEIKDLKIERIRLDELQLEMNSSG